MGGRFGGTTDGSSAYEDRRPPLEEREDEHEAVMEALEEFQNNQRKEDGDDTTDPVETDIDTESEESTDTEAETGGDTGISDDTDIETEDEDGMAAGIEKRAEERADGEQPRTWHEAVKEREGYNDLVLNEYTAHAAGGETEDVASDEVYEDLFGRMDDLGPMQSGMDSASSAAQQSGGSAETADSAGNGDSFGTTSLAASSGVLDDIGGVDYADLEESGEAGTPSSSSDVRTDRSGLDTTLGSQRKAEMHRLERGTDIAGGHDWDKNEPVPSSDPDPRDSLSGEDLGAVNDAARDLTAKHDDATQAEISHQLASTVEQGDVGVGTAAAELDDKLAEGSASLESLPEPSDDPRHQRTRIQQEEIEADFDHLQQIHDETAEGVNTGERASIAHAANEQARIAPREVLPNAPDDTGSYRPEIIEDQWGMEGRESVKRGIQTIRQGFEDGTVEIPTETADGPETVETTLQTEPIADAAVDQLTEEAGNGVDANYPPRRAVSDVISELDNTQRLNDVFDASGYDAREYLSTEETETVTEAVNDLENDFPQLVENREDTEQRLAGMIVDKGYTESDALVMDTVRDATDSGEMAWTKGQIDIDQYYTPLMDSEIAHRDTALRTGKRDQKYPKGKESDFQYLGHKFQASAQYIGRDDSTDQPQYRADVEGRVNGLEDPSSSNQHQVGFLSAPEGHDQYGTPTKFTWFKSSGMNDKVAGRSGDAPTITGSRDYLRVGDQVRFHDATVSQYEGANGPENTVGVREVTEIEIVDEGDGAIIYEGMGKIDQTSREQTTQSRDAAFQSHDRPDLDDYETVEDYWDDVDPGDDARRPANADTVTAEQTVVADDSAFAPDELGDRDGVETSVDADGAQQYTTTDREHGRQTGNPYRAVKKKEREKEQRKGKQYQDSRESYHEYQRKRWDIPEEVYESGEAEQRESDKESRRNGYRRDAQEQFGYTDTQVHADLPWPGNETERRPHRPASDSTPSHRPDVDEKKF